MTASHPLIILRGNSGCGKTSTARLLQRQLGYGTMLRRLLDDFQGEQLIYYFDVSFEETVRRHATKPNAHEFGESEMRQWWKDQDVLDVPGEQRIGEKLAQAEIVDMIYRDVLALSEETISSASHM
ncbi:hypothetical protein FBF27_04315 [Candidatus Saccharibacteria bacterium oral taxon 488]|nr:hypothetical protein FBF27_04315 [Candidatus Saccharibacteria bacterium oral taxon 488]